MKKVIQITEVSSKSEQDSLNSKDINSMNLHE